jgi:hypothetical protein
MLTLGCRTARSIALKLGAERRLSLDDTVDR